MPDEPTTEREDFAEIRHPKQRQFLAAFGETGMVGYTATLVGVHRSTHHHWVRTDETYAAAFERARAQALTTLEDEAWRRAAQGVRKVIRWQGVPVGEEFDYSDTLMIVLLKANAPEKYRERVSADVTVRTPVDVELERLIGELEAPKALEP